MEISSRWSVTSKKNDQLYEIPKLAHFHIPARKEPPTDLKLPDPLARRETAAPLGYQPGDLNQAILTSTVHLSTPAAGPSLSLQRRHLNHETVLHV
jgi:hypothetical protein